MDPTDEVLLERARSSGAAYAAFYHRHVADLLAYFRRRTPDAETAADLTAETFAAALESVDGFDPARGPAIGWLYGIARRRYADYVRAGRASDRARRRLGIAPLALTDEALEGIERVAAAQLHAQVSELLDELPEAQRRALHAHVIDEQSYDEIAARERLAPAAVRQRVSRALRALRIGLERGA